MVGVVRTRLEGIGEAVAATDSTPAVVTDTIRGRTQQLVAAGYRTTRWSVSLTDRARPINGSMLHAPAIRGRLGGSRYAVGAFAE